MNRIAPYLVIALLTACHASAPTNVGAFAGRVVNATAPPGVAEQQLGMPHDARFLAIQGSEGASLFPDAGHARRSPLNQMQHEYVLVENEEMLAANLNGWGFLTAEAAGGVEWRHASYRAMQIAYVVDVDDTTDMREPPAGAVYYLSRIYYGHSYEMVLSGRTRDFHAGVRAQLASFGGSVDGFAKAHHLTMKAVGRGLEPRDGHAIFAKTPGDIEARYSPTGPPVPIVVEFRQIPNTRGLAGVIPWPEPVRIELRLGQLAVGQDGTWGATPWTMSLSCQASGTPVPLGDSFVWQGDTNDGGTYPINRTWQLELLPGERFDCGVDGSYSGPIAGVHQLPSGRMQAPVDVGPATAITGFIPGGDQSVSYRVDFSAMTLR